MYTSLAQPSTPLLDRNRVFAQIHCASRSLSLLPRRGKILLVASDELFDVGGDDVELAVDLFHFAGREAEAVGGQTPIGRPWPTGTAPATAREKTSHINRLLRI